MILQRFPLFILAIAGVLLSACAQRNEEADSTSNIELPENRLEIREAWARPAQQGMTGGAYLTIVNGTEQTDTLLSVSADAAAMAEVHESFQENGISGMRPAGKLPIEPRSTLELKPGGYHIMMMQLSQELTAGDTISATLYFSHLDSLKIQIPVLQNRD